MQKIEISVVDFDGTLIPFNSFPQWIIHIFLCSLKSLSINNASKIAILLLKRKTGILSHEEFKKKLIESDHPEQWDVSFALKMEKKLNLKVIKNITPHIKNTKCIISSAAPARYISRINFQRYLPTHAIIGSHITTKNNSLIINENFQKTKLENILQKYPHAKIKYVITDHHDDIPLIKSAQNSIIINPTLKTKQLITQNVKSSSVIFYSDLS